MASMYHTSHGVYFVHMCAQAGICLLFNKSCEETDAELQQYVPMRAWAMNVQTAHHKGASNADSQNELQIRVLNEINRLTLSGLVFEAIHACDSCQIHWLTNLAFHRFLFVDKVWQQVHLRQKGAQSR